MRATANRSTVGAERRRAIALGVGAALAVLVAAEVVARLVVEPNAAPLRFHMRPTDVDDRSGGFRADDLLGYALTPNYRSSPDHAGMYALGAWPWRGRPAEPAPPDMVRVLVFGDSNVYGIGVDVVDTLPERIAAELDARGLPRTRVQVLNFGVPGFTTVQVQRLVERQIDELRPAAIVLYVAAVNDQAPADGRSDAEMLEAFARRSFVERTALARILRSLSRGTDASPVAPAGAPPTSERPRVPREDVEPNVARMLAHAAARGVTAVVVAPTHPSTTLVEMPRVAEDRDAVVRAARAADVVLVDATALTRAAGLRDEESFVDFIHPAPETWRVIAPHVADALVPALVARAGSNASASASFAVASVEPRSASTFGDVSITVTLSGAPPSDEVPAIIVGGAPLLDVERIGTHVFVGTLATNGPGTHDVLVQSRLSCAQASGALELVAPSVERTTEGFVVVVARAGDRATLFCARDLAPVPRASPIGMHLLDLATTAVVAEVEIGADGRSAAIETDAGAWLQALVAPRGESPLSKEARLTLPLLSR
jgi:lysophospholipase L1-like esterase